MKRIVVFTLCVMLCLTTLFAQQPVKPLRIADTLTPKEKAERNPVILRSELDSLIKAYTPVQLPVEVQKPEPAGKESYGGMILGGLALLVLIAVSGMIVLYRQRNELRRIADSVGAKNLSPGELKNGKTKTGKKNPPPVTAQEQLEELFEAVNRLEKENASLNGVIKEYNGIRHDYDSLRQGVMQAYKVKNYPGYEKTREESSTIRTVLDTEKAVADHAYTRFLKPILTITDANNGVTTLGYNLADQLTSVTDPRTLKTQYQYNGLGDLIKQISPDTGSTSYRYAADGQRSGQTDARNKATDDTLDAAGRVTQRNQAGVITQYSYGAANDPDPTRIGRLVQYTDPSGTTQLGYNLRGQLTRKSISYTTVGSVTATRVLQYQYDDKGRLSGITYPSGLQIGYHYTVDQLDSIQLNGQDLIKQIQWQGPSQRLSSWTWANGQQSQWQYDSNGRISLIKHGDRYSKSYQYDDAGRLLQQNDSLTPVLGQSYQYDKLDRLTQTTRNTTTEQYQYDADSNRSSKTVGSASTAYTYPATNNRLSSAGTTAFTYDAAGNITKGRYSYSYDNGGRLSTVKNGTTTLSSYWYNTLGQRVIQSSNGKPIHYVYDEAGHRIGSYADPATQQISDETVWLGDLPIATVRQDNGQAKAWYLHSDHLATPRQVVDPASNSVLWQWEGEAFGATPPDEDPDHDGKKFIQNLRFPGQWQDRVSGLVYNYYRDYDPELGRYIQSDPIGLKGGINTYGYVGGNPLQLSDPEGLTAACGTIGTLGQPSHETACPSELKEPPKADPSQEKAGERSCQQKCDRFKSISPIAAIIGGIASMMVARGTPAPVTTVAEAGTGGISQQLLSEQNDKAYQFCSKQCKIKQCIFYPD